MTTTTNNDELFSRYELWCEEHETTATLIGFAHWQPMRETD